MLFWAFIKKALFVNKILIHEPADHNHISSACMAVSFKA